MPLPLASTLPVLDFSFCEIQDVRDLLRVPARHGKAYVAPVQETAATTQETQPRPKDRDNDEDDDDGAHSGQEDDTSTAGKDSLKKGPSGGSGEPETEEAMQNAVQYITSSVKLGNNRLADASSLTSVLKVVVIDSVKTITSLDLSLNLLTSIPGCLAELTHLAVLYLHANAIKDVEEVHKLKPLEELYFLTLNGNPIENTKNYRFFVLWALPKLKSLDFVTYSKRDRETVGTYVSFFKPGQPARKKGSGGR
eukprot:RCo030485